MEKVIIMCLLACCSQAFAQTGVNIKNPASTFEIKSGGSTSSTKALEINNSSNVVKAEVVDNGNFTFYGALMPNGIAGNSGDVLTSSGPGQSPYWKKIEIPEGTKLITQIFNARRNDLSGTSRSANSTAKLDFPTIIIAAVTEVGSWANNEFTAAKKGLYHISAGFTAKLASGSSTSTTGIMSISTSAYNQGSSGQVTKDYNTDIYYMHFSGQLIVPLDVGQKIWVTGQIANGWNQNSGYLHIKFSEQ